MRLIIGGACQGKRTYAAAQYGLSREDIRDCSDFAPGDFAEKKCVCRFHLFLRNQMKSGGDVITVTSKIVQSSPGILILMDEIGCGVIPMEREERLWREETGRAGCYLAAHAESVERVVCGCGVRIK